MRHPPPYTHHQVRRVGLDQTLLEVSGTLEVFPHRTILLPATLLLPEVLPIRATLQIGVEGPLDMGAVELVVAKWVSVTQGLAGWRHSVFSVLGRWGGGGCLVAKWVSVTHRLAGCQH